jgi:hypothetical protein
MEGSRGIGGSTPACSANCATVSIPTLSARRMVGTFFERTSASRTVTRPSNVPSKFRGSQ